MLLPNKPIFSHSLRQLFHTQCFLFNPTIRPINLYSHMMISILIKQRIVAIWRPVLQASTVMSFIHDYASYLLLLYAQTSIQGSYLQLWSIFHPLFLSQGILFHHFSCTLSLWATWGQVFKYILYTFKSPEPVMVLGT